MRPPSSARSSRCSRRCCESLTLTLTLALALTLTLSLTVTLPNQVLSELLREHLNGQREQAAKLAEQAASLARIEACIGALEHVATVQQGGASPPHVSPLAEGVRHASDHEDVLACIHLDDDEVDR